MTAKHIVFGEKLYGVHDTPAATTYLVCGDPTDGPVVATMETPDHTGFMDAEDAIAVAGEIERRWNIHQPLAEALHELRAWVGKLSTNSGQDEAERADAVLHRLRFEPGGEKVLKSQRERFEAWFRSLPECTFVQELILTRSADGKYESESEQKLWEAYRAADSGLPTPQERRFISLINRFFEAFPNIEENEHLSGADMIQFVTLWMRDARRELDNAVTA